MEGSSMHWNLWVPSVKRGCIGLTILSAALIAQGQQPEENPFQARGDRSELVKILPTPAAVQARHDISSSAAPAHSGATVYKASYGVGNLIYHSGGRVMVNPAFYPIFWNSDAAGPAGASQGYLTVSSEISAFAAAFLNGLSSYTQSSGDDFTIVGQYKDSSGHDAVPTAGASSLGPLVDTQAATSTISDSGVQQY